jgi:hypothetical protein
MRPVLFKQVNLKQHFHMNDKVFRKIEAVFLANCCVPEYNAINVEDESDKVLVPFYITVEIE